MILKKKENWVIKLLVLVPSAWFFVTYMLTVTTNFPDVDIVTQAGPIITDEENLPWIEIKNPNFDINEHVKNGFDVESGRGVLPAPRQMDQPGEMGEPVILTNLTKEEQKLVDEGWKTHSFNQFVSDMISVRRNLPDPRDDMCKRMDYPTDLLPTTSIIICFHNEAWSVLLRTIHSILDRSPQHLIREIILVDDFSDLPHLNETLENYLIQFPKVKLIRAKKREGLIRARIIGADAAKAPILTYLDSHIECTEGWLEPLLHRIYQNRTAVVSPLIDKIADDTFEFFYHEDYKNPGFISVGGFDWNMEFVWTAIPSKMEKYKKEPWKPLETPTMAGGLFSIDKEFFEYLGTYDKELDTWGGENLELSFKTWMCGGSLEMIPCSHVGHVFRKYSPYKWPDTMFNVLKRNAVRVAKVWLDDYAKYFYGMIQNKLGEYGDVTSRIELRKKLNCKSFKWYLDNIYPEMFIPDEAIGRGEIRNLGSKRKAMCLDSKHRNRPQETPVSVYKCHGAGGNQFWMMSSLGEIRKNDGCLDFTGKEVVLAKCHSQGGNQAWSYDPETNAIKSSSSSKLCLYMSSDEKSVRMTHCFVNETRRQRWLFQSWDPSRSKKNVLH